jgi:hypothetical protein
MISYVQSKANQSLAGDTVSATFDTDIAKGNGLLAAVTWIDPDSNSAPYPTITVADLFGAWEEIVQNTVPLGGDILTAVFFVPYSEAGPNGPVVATSSAPGILFITIHEIAPSAGEMFVFGTSGVNAGIGFNSSFSFPVGDMIQLNPPSPINATAYAFLVFATRTGNILPTVAGLTPRQYVANPTTIGSVDVQGSQATFDTVGNFYDSYAPIYPDWNYFASVVNAVYLTIVSVPAIAHAPTGGGGGEYPSDQTVTLTQDQGFDIRFTTDGTDPTSASPLYTGPILIAEPTTLKAIATQPAGSPYPPGFWANSAIAEWVYDIFTGTCLNPGNIIDGDDTTFATLTCHGASGDVVAVKTNMMHGTTGGPGALVVDYEVTENDLVAPSQTLPAWKVSAFIGAVETVLASAPPGAGPVARTNDSLPVPAGVSAPTLATKIAAICEIPGSTGGVQLKVYAAYLLEPAATEGFGLNFGNLFGG